MKVGIEKISETEYEKLTVPVLLEDKSGNRAFGIVTSDGKSVYKLTWQSNNIKPVITELNSTLYSVGIDLFF